MARSWRSVLAGDRGLADIGAAALLSHPLPAPQASPAHAAQAALRRGGASRFRFPAGLIALLDARPRACLVLLCLALWLPGFFTLPPTDRDESRFAQATKQMLETGDFVRIMNGSVPRNRKPIGIYWLQAPFAAAARATGLATQNPVWPYRVPSLLGGIAAVLATYSLGLTLLADRRAALLASAMLASCVILTVEAHIAKTDATLLGATTVAMAVLARAWRGGRLGAGGAAVFWISLGASVLIKGPVGPMVLGATVLAAGFSTRSWAWLRALRPGWGAPLLLAMILPWFIAIGLATHGAFFADAVGGDLGSKLAGGSESHGAWPGFHLLLLPLLAFPATVPVLAGLAAAWPRRRDPATLFLLCWLVPAWLIFEAVPTKLPHYTLPLYPALFLLAATWLRDAVAPPWAVRGATLLLAVVALIIGVAASGLPLAAGGPWWLGVPALLAAGLVFACAARGRVLVAALASVLLYAAVLHVEIPNLQPLWFAPRLVAVLRNGAPEIGPDGAGLVTAGYAEPSLMFLAGTHLDEAPNGAAAARWLARTGHGVAIVTAEDMPDFTAISKRRGVVVKSIGSVAGINTARGVKMRLDVMKMVGRVPPAVPAQ